MNFLCCIKSLILWILAFHVNLTWSAKSLSHPVDMSTPAWIPNNIVAGDRPMNLFTLLLYWTCDPSSYVVRQVYASKFCHCYKIYDFTKYIVQWITVNEHMQFAWEDVQVGNKQQLPVEVGMPSPTPATGDRKSKQILPCKAPSWPSLQSPAPRACEAGHAQTACRARPPTLNQ